MTANEMKFSFQLKFDSLFEFTAPAYDDRQMSYVLTEAQFRIFIKKYNPLGNKYQKGFEADEKRRRDLEQLIKPATIVGVGKSNAIKYYISWDYTGPTAGNVVVSSTNTHGADMLTTNGLVPGMTISATGIGAIATPNVNVIKEIIDDNTFTVVDTLRTASAGILINSGIGLSSAQGGVHPNGIFLDMPSDFLYAVEEAAKVKINNVANTKESWIRPVKHDEYLSNINNPYKKPYKDLVWRMDISRSQIADGTSVLASAKRSELVLPENVSGNTYTLDYYRLRYLATPPSIVVDEFDPENQKHCVLDETLHREIVDEAVVIAQAAAQKESYQIGAAEAQRSE